MRRINKRRSKIVWASQVGFALAFSFSINGESDPRWANLEFEDLAPPSEPEGDTLFTELPPDRSGLTVVNSYDDPRMWGERYQEMVFGTIGTGVAVGDYDNDGRADVFIPIKTGGSRLYRNTGDMRFEDVTEASGLLGPEAGWATKVWGLFSDDEEEGPESSWDQGAVFADVNNDGWLDLYVTCFAAANRLYLNQGDGTFREEAENRGLAIRDGSGVPAFCDYDRDGWLDLYLQTNMLNALEGPDGRPDLLLRNTGDGYFSDVTAAAGISGPTAGHSATWWDYDQDGWPDVYVANDFGTLDRLYRNLGDGTFKDALLETVPRLPYYAMGADIGDVNNDGKIDFLVGDMAPTTHEKDQRGMAVSRAREMQKQRDRLPPQRMHNALYLNTGVSKFREVAWLAGVARTDWTWSVRFEDLDCDGLLDLHVTNGMVREYHNVDILDKIMAAVSLQSQRGVMRSSPELSESNLSYRNLGGLRFERSEREWGLGQVGVSFGAGFGDFDGDGDLDLVVSNHGSAPTVLRNDCAGGSRAVFALSGTRSNRFGAGARVMVETASGVQVRELVLARGYLSGSEPVLHFGLGADDTMERVEVLWPSGARQSFSGLPAGRRYAVREPEAGASTAPPAEASPPPLFEEASGRLGLSLDPGPPSPGRPAEQPLSPVGFSRRGPFVAAGDVDGDGRADLALGSAGASPARLLLSSAGFAPSELPGGPLGGPLALGDFDGDGSLDLLAAGSDASPPGPGSVRGALLLGDGRGGLALAGSLPASAPPLAGSASAFDFDGDGFADVFVGARSPAGSWPLPGRSALLRGTAGGALEDASALLPAGGELGSVSGSAWGDVDGDGRPDLVVALEWGRVLCLLNRGASGFEEAGEGLGFAAAGTGWWGPVAAGDFDGDGLADFAVGNLGLNTPYRPGDALYYGDFGGRGPGQLVEARRDGAGREVPRRSRRELGEAVPSVLRRFASNDAYAAATLEEAVGGGESLSGALRLELSELRSGVFLSGSGYRFAALPRLAQASPAQSLAAGDFDGDGRLDLAATQNLGDVDPVLGRFGGGLGQLLLGDGRGGFSAAEPSASGLVVPGEGRGLAALDLDGDGRLDLFAARWGAPSLAFLNKGEEK